VHVGILWVLLIGFVVGAVAKFFIPGKNPSGCLITSVLGIGGAWVGQRLIWMAGFHGPVGFIGSVLGAMIILAIYHALSRKS
jgi:uncharacterized membrane protein YeaQ/YmgE (transglycosylase-associated protein family)